MFPLSLLATAALILPAVVALPTQPSGPGIVPPLGDPERILCHLPILKKFLCPLATNVVVSKATVLGSAPGVMDPDGALRFSVKYASAARWQPSTIVTSWNLPNGFTNASAMPLPCAQLGVDDSQFSEDCLSMILYVPPGLTLTSSAPTLVWIHGGSFIIGSATGVGLDGSKLALATNSIVAVMQYRLGVFGFTAPNGQKNLALKDVVTGLQFLKKVLPSFGGSPSKVTLAGQSSGAHMIRSLLGVPSAASLFRSAILQSDPMNFGPLSLKTHNALLANFTAELGCGTDATCLNSLSAIDILNVEWDLFNLAVDIDPAAGQFEPIRPVLDGVFFTNPLDGTKPFPSVSKPLLLTSVTQEAGQAIYSMDTSPVAESDLLGRYQDTFGPARAAVIMGSPFYPAAPQLGGSADARVQLQTVGTDYLWRCSSWTFAKNWVQHGGSAYVGQFAIGATYPSNEDNSYCTQPGIVCHEDDIQIVFGTVPNPSPVQFGVITQTQNRYKAFLSGNNPNGAGVTVWPAATSSNVHPILLGGVGETAVGACTSTFWGANPQYDYQVFNQ